ncbi:hypothetical protein ACSSV5_001917 [Psychroflexus sp. MBR-150]|jgi:hypothetical protein
MFFKLKDFTSQNTSTFIVQTLDVNPCHSDTEASVEESFSEPNPLSFRGKRSDEESFSEMKTNT